MMFNNCVELLTYIRGRICCFPFFGLHLCGSQVKCVMITTLISLIFRVDWLKIVEDVKQQCNNATFGHIQEAKY